MKYPYTRLLANTITYIITLAVTVTNTGCANLTAILTFAASIAAGLNIFTTTHKIITERKQQ